MENSLAPVCPAAFSRKYFARIQQGTYGFVDLRQPVIVLSLNRPGFQPGLPCKASDTDILTDKTGAFQVAPQYQQLWYAGESFC